MAEIGRDALEDSVENLLDQIDAGRVMSFTVEGV